MLDDEVARLHQQLEEQRQENERLVRLAGGAICKLHAVLGPCGLFVSLIYLH